jgi:murein DD-endopeptidase MepM/ murein hydrolase activator NlpD
VVQRGETLFRIAQNYGVTVDDIARINGLINPSNIKVGERLVIPLESQPVPVAPTQHRVGPGETLFAIAQFYGTTEAVLIQLNGITNPNVLYVGQELTITPGSGGVDTVPPVSQPATPPTEAPPPPTDTPPVAVASVDSGVRHVIQRGETLFRIAQRYGVDLATLQAANSIASPSLIYAGQVLTIPTSGSTGAGEVSAIAALPPVLTSFSVTPDIWREGKTGRVLFSTRGPATVTATFLNQTLQVISLENATQHRVYFGVPLKTSPNIYALTLNVTEATGEVTVFETNLNVVAGNYSQQRITLPADKAELVAVSVDENELALLRGITNRFNPEAFFNGPMSLPAAAAMNVPFGLLRAYNGGPFDRYHVGVDFASPAGAPILAAAPGRVVMADRLNIRGVSVVIEHGWGVFSNYSHMNQLNVALGEFVQVGQVIGTVGTTGRTTGAHLHWEVWVNGTPVDPMQWVYDVFP